MPDWFSWSEEKIKKEWFFFHNFLHFFRDYEGSEDLLHLERREGTLQSFAPVGLDGLREDLPPGKVFLYRFPVERLSHVGGFSHRVLDPDDYQMRWFFVARDKEEIFFADSANSLERRLGGNYHLLLPGEKDYLMSGQEDKIRRVRELEEMPYQSWVTVAGVRWQKRSIKKEIPLIELEDRSVHNPYSFQEEKSLAAWSNEDGVIRTSEQLVELKTFGGSLVPESFSLDRHLKLQGKKKKGRGLFLEFRR